MTDEEIKAAVESAIECVRSEDPPLAFNDVHERTIAHRLAVHLERYFQGWNIDCEYNRDRGLKKRLEGIKECGDGRTTDRIYPDIIVHHRRDPGPEHNLLVIELKGDEEENACDRMKLELLTGDKDHYQYQLGLYVNICGGKFRCAWYKQGKKQAG